MRFVFACLIALLVAVPCVPAGPERSILVEQNGGFDNLHESPAVITAKALITHQRNGRKNVARAATSVDVGDVAVLVDNGSMLLPPRPANRIDLSNRSFTFTPIPGGFSVTAGSLSLDPSTGSPLPLGDDDTVLIAVPFAFPFLGTSYTEFYLNSDGNITLGQFDAGSLIRNAALLVSGPPRVAPLLLDLDVTSGGSISADVRPDRAVVTWTEVPEYGTINRNTFQITLYGTGRFDFVYGNLQTVTPQTGGATGVAIGNNGMPLNEIDFASLGAATYQAGAIFEEFYFARVLEQVDIAQVAKEFYRTHPDHFDMLVMFINFEAQVEALAYAAGTQNHTKGLGLPDYDISAHFGSAGELETFIHMNDVDFYWADERKLVDPPIDMFIYKGGASWFFPPGNQHISRRARRLGNYTGHGSFTIGLDSPVGILAHEVLHRWAAFVPIVHPTTGIGPDSLDLLGRDAAHWSFFFSTRLPDSQFGGDPRASTMEGNAYIDFGSNIFGDCSGGRTRFRTEPNELTDGFSELDQYLMGLRRAEEVSPFWYIDNPTPPHSEISFEYLRGISPIDDIGVCGNRVNLTLANITSFPGIGPRIPAIGDEDDDGQGNDVKTQAYILVVQNKPGGYTEAVRQVDNFRRAFQKYGNGPATGGRGKFDTSLHPVVH